MQIRFLCSVVLLLVLPSVSLNAQQAIATSGGNAVGIGGTVSYTVGQLAYKNVIGTTGALSEGVQQSFSISVSTGEELKNVTLNFIAFPNPAKDYLKLEVNNPQLGQLDFEFINLKGAILKKGNFTSNVLIDTEEFPSAIYFIHIKDNNTIIKTFKVAKN